MIRVPNDWNDIQPIYTKEQLEAEMKRVLDMYNIFYKQNPQIEHNFNMSNGDK